MKRALIVDDEPICVELIENLIKKCHMPIEIVGKAFCGNQAVELAKRYRPNLIYLDIEMPDMSGLDVMAAIQKNLDYTPDVMVITAYGNFEYAQSAFRLGARDILLKPIDSQKFFEAMERVQGFRYTDNQSLNEMLSYVHSHYRQAIDLDHMSTTVHLSKSHISRLFNQHLETTFIHYRNRLRIEQAKELLRDTEKSVQEISQYVGFDSLHYFYKIFRLVTGKTPKTYKEE